MMFRQTLLAGDHRAAQQTMDGDAITQEQAKMLKEQALQNILYKTALAPTMQGFTATGHEGMINPGRTQAHLPLKPTTKS